MTLDHRLQILQSIPRAMVTLYSPEIIGAVDTRRTELLRARRRAQDDAQSEAIERILS